MALGLIFIYLFFLYQPRARRADLAATFENMCTFYKENRRDGKRKLKGGYLPFENMIVFHKENAFKLILFFSLRAEAAPMSTYVHLMFSIMKGFFKNLHIFVIF